MWPKASSISLLIDESLVKSADSMCLVILSSDNAGARKCAGIAKEKFVKTISLLHQMEVCAPSQTSGVKNLVSTRFFTLPDHAARQSGSLRRISRRRILRRIRRALGRLAAQSSESEKNAIERFFHSSAAGEEDYVPERAVNGVEGRVDYLKKAHLAGTMFMGGVTVAGEKLNHPAWEEARKVGRKS